MVAEQRLPAVVWNAKGLGPMPPKPETFSALSHSAEWGESLGGLGVAALLGRSRQILRQEMEGAANATELIRRR